MIKFKEYAYRLETLSPIILSPRDHQGFYRDIGEFVKDDLVSFNDVDVDKIKIIYPFYQYGTYPQYKPDETQYYIPGSSIKGAICSGTKIMMDDITVESCMLQLRHLHKIQNIPREGEKSVGSQQIEFDQFFPSVAVEMLYCKEGLSGVLYCEENPCHFFALAQKNTMDKLEQFKYQIGKVLESHAGNMKDDCKKVLIQLKKNIQDLTCQANELNEGTYIINLGGYKGLALSGIFKEKDYQSAIYIDKKSNFPHGLVKINLQ